MILTRTNVTSILLGAVAISTFASIAAAQDYVVAERIQAASRCTDFGPGFIDMGNGVCARTTNGSRVQLGARTVHAGSWSTDDGTSSATLRSSGDMLPGASVQHLRIPNVAADSPFR